MASYQLIQPETPIDKGDRIRRPLENGEYDVIIVGEYLSGVDAYEVNIFEEPGVANTKNVSPYLSKENMVAEGWEILTK